MAARLRTSTKGKVRVNFMIDRELHERMQKINDSLNFNINWSQMINQALGPVVKLFEEALIEVGKGDKGDLNKIRFLLQGNVIESMGQAIEGLKEVQRDIDESMVDQKRNRKE